MLIFGCVHRGANLPLFCIAAIGIVRFYSGDGISYGEDLQALYVSECGAGNVT
jgi:hypothetical protein